MSQTVVKIESDIVDYKVQTVNASEIPTDQPQAKLEMVHEDLQRPDVLQGSTYKIKSLNDESHALYVTFNDVVLNLGTGHEERRPFEVFISCKNPEHFQWITALTRVMSAVFRKGGDVTFLVEELMDVFDPRGGYFIPGGKGLFANSLVAHIGIILKKHFTTIGLIKDEIDEHKEAYIAQKHAQAVEADAGGYPASATLCNKCHTKAMVLMDGCSTCLSCGESKCN